MKAGLNSRLGSNPPGLLRLEPYSPGLRERVWWGSSSNATAVWAARIGMNLQSSTLKADESGRAFHVQQANQIRAYRQAWKEAGREPTPRVSVSRSVFALVNDLDRAYFGRDASRDQIGIIEDMRAVFRRSYAAEPDRLIEELRVDEAIAEAAHCCLRAQPARRRLQRPCHRGHPDARRARARLALERDRAPQPLHH